MKSQIKKSLKFVLACVILFALVLPFASCERQDEAQSIEIVKDLIEMEFTLVYKKEIIKNIMAEIGASSIKDMGKVMAELKGRYAGQVDMGKASSLIKGLLG